MKFLNNKSGKALEPTAQRGAGCPVFLDTQGQPGGPLSSPIQLQVFNSPAMGRD